MSKTERLLIGLYEFILLGSFSGFNVGVIRLTLRTLGYIVVKIKELNAGEVILTSIDNEGTMKGYDNNVYKIACEILESPVIASGGCGNPNHMNEVLKYSRVSALAAASMFHFTEITPILCKKFFGKSVLKNIICVIIKSSVHRCKRFKIISKLCIYKYSEKI